MEPGSNDDVAAGMSGKARAVTRLVREIAIEGEQLSVSELCRFTDAEFVG